jgi:hypothetical protein
MTNAYLIEVKIINIFNSSLSKYFIFKNKEDAYNFAINIEQNIKKTIINPIESLDKNPLVWSSNKLNFPRYICEIKPIDNNVLCSLYINNNESQLLNYIYKNLKINNIID